MEMENFYWIGLKAVPGIGNVAFRRLLERFDTPEAALKASPALLYGIRGITPAVIEAIKNGEWIRFAEEECRRLEASAARLVTYISCDYPKSLFEIPDPPPFLYIKGELRSHELSIAIVGSRRATSYGLMTTGKLAEALAGHGG
ncbi:MAG TPA: DNA-processing protein DprA, partial [Desulfuromonadaceae bacterium]